MIPLYIGLDAFEHALLDEFVNVFALDPRQNLEPDELYDVVSLWRWFSTVTGDYEWSFYDKEEKLDVGAGHVKAWEVFLSRISDYSNHPRFSRSETLRAQNPKFPQCLQEQDIGREPVYRIWPADRTAWPIVSSLLNDMICCYVNAQTTALYDRPPDPLYLLFSAHNQDSDAMNASNSRQVMTQVRDEITSTGDQFEPDFEIWSILRGAASLRRGQHNLAKVAQFLKAGGFLDKHVSVSYTGQYVCKRSLAQLAERLSIELVPDSNDIYDLLPEYLSLLHPIRPLSCLEFISWKELHRVHPSSNDSIANDSSYVCWSAENICRLDHHFFTEEEVYRHCVTGHWTFPGHLENGEVLFKLTPLCESDLLADLTAFWKDWNDIAITQHLDSGEWFVLETLPGIKFRDILNHNNRLTALRYFRNLANEASLGPRESLQDALGLNFQPRFENLLEIIPCEQITHVSQSPMRGAYGAVFRATWARPASIGVAMAQNLDIALKTIAAADGLDQNKIFSELDVTFSATLGQEIGSVRFWGVTRTPPEEHEQMQLQRLGLPPNTVLLIFDFAVHGSLLSYLQKPMDGEKLDWWTILEFIGAAADGMHNLHDVGIVHRDLHLGNILVIERQKSADGIEETAKSAVLADFGEGKMIHGLNQAADPSLRSAGNRATRPPEVHTYDDYTAISDVFDFGRLLEELVILQWRLEEKRNGGRRYRLLPLWLYEIIQQCLEQDPSKRVTSTALSRQLDALGAARIDKREDERFELIDPEAYNFKEEDLAAAECMDEEIPEA